MSDERIIRVVLRGMAWERAKGELRSIMDTFWDDSDEDFRIMSKAIEDFIEKVESELPLQ